MFLILGIFVFSLSHIKTMVKTDDRGVYFEVHTPNLSTDFTLYLTEYNYTRDSILHTSYPDFDIWDRDKTEDTIFVFRPTRRRKIERNSLYIYRVSLFDLKNKNTLASPIHFFRLNKNGNIGIYPEIYPVMQLLSEDTIGIFTVASKPCFAELTLKFNNAPDITITHNKKTKRHEFIVPYKKGLLLYRITYYTKYDTFITPTIPIKYSGKIKSFAIFGDTRANWAMPSSIGRTDGVNEEVLHSMLRAIYKENVDFVEINGDLISGYTPSKEDAVVQYTAFLKALFPYSSSIPVLLSPGNHDMTSPMNGDRKMHMDPRTPASAEDLWASMFMLPTNGPIAEDGLPPYIENTYFLGTKDIGIFFLNSDYNYAKKGRKLISGNITNTELIWFNRQSRKFKHTIVIFHEPLYSNTGITGHSLDYDIPYRDSVLKVILGSNALLLLTSHEHLYARRKIPSKVADKWLYQITLGSGGAPLYIISKDIQTQLDAFSKETSYAIITLAHKRLLTVVKNLNGFTIDSLEVKY